MHAFLTIVAWTALGMGYALITLLGLGGISNWFNKRG